MEEARSGSQLFDFRPFRQLGNLAFGLRRHGHSDDLPAVLLHCDDETPAIARIPLQLPGDRTGAIDGSFAGSLIEIRQSEGTFERVGTVFQAKETLRHESLKLFGDIVNRPGP